MIRIISGTPIRRFSYYVPDDMTINGLCKELKDRHNSSLEKKFFRVSINGQRPLNKRDKEIMSGRIIDYADIVNDEYTVFVFLLPKMYD